MNTSVKICTLPELKNALRDCRRQGSTVVLTNGCFDLLHAGHISYLEQAKAAGQRVLVVALNSDSSVRLQNKGADRPVVPQDFRARLMAALACVDYVVVFDEPTPEQLIQEILPDVLVKGADWKGKPVAGAEAVKAAGGRVEFLDFVDGLSTTSLIEKIRRSSAG